MVKPSPLPSATSVWDLSSDGLTRSSDARFPLDFSDPAFLRGEAEGAFKRISRYGARVFFSSIGGSGTADVVRFNNGAEINVVNCVMPTLRRRSHESDEALIMLRASLCCDAVLRAQGLPPVVFNRPELTLVCVPKGVSVVIDVQGGVRQQSVNGIFRTSAFAAAYGLQPQDLPPVVRDAVEGKGSFGRVVSLPLDHFVASLVADTIDTPLQGEMRALQYAGRLAELVAYTLSALRDAPLAHKSTLSRWSDADLAQLALERLTRDYRQPPAFNELASELGTNVVRLQSSFKGAYGVTMGQYCLERRMREAQQLLLEGKLTIAQVAERVGYTHQSNFTTAFSSHVGMAPREYRRHKARINLPLGEAVGDNTVR